MEDKKYKRLTERGYHYDAIPLSLRHIRRLQELEDKIEDKVLVELPCPIGAPIWDIDIDIPDDDDFTCSYDCPHYCGGWYGDEDCEKEYEMYPSIIVYIKTKDKSNICPKMRPVLRKNKLSWYYWGQYQNYYGITWFTDEREAIAAHQKLMEEYDAKE